MTNWNEIQTQWEDYSKKISSNWGKLTDAQIATINGNRLALSNAIQHTYQCDAVAAEQQIGDWLNNLLGANASIPPSVDNLEEKLEQNQNTAETIEERDTVVGSPYHKGY